MDIPANLDTVELAATQDPVYLDIVDLVYLDIVVIRDWD